ncbi:MAG: hypothetical protein IJE62_07400 [Clostridia bacterium]|nr:hypothetical protein [Clostridia bacterium]
MAAFEKTGSVPFCNVLFFRFANGDFIKERISLPMLCAGLYPPTVFKSGIKSASSYQRRKKAAAIKITSLHLTSR